MAITQKYSLLDYMRADKVQPWPLPDKCYLLRPLVAATSSPMDIEKWAEVAKAFNVMSLAKEEGLLIDKDNYLRLTEADLVGALSDSQEWPILANSVSTQFAYFLEEVPQATYIRLHRKMVQRSQKNGRQPSDTKLGKRDFAAAS